MSHSAENDATLTALTEALTGHMPDTFYVNRPQGPGWYCRCGEAYAGDEPYTPEAFAAHLARVATRVLPPGETS